MKHFIGDVTQSHIHRMAVARGAPAWVLVLLSDNPVLLMKLPEWDGTDSKACRSDAPSVAFLA